MSARCSVLPCELWLISHFKVSSKKKKKRAKVFGVLLIVRGLLRRPSLSGSLIVTFCSVHIHSVVAMKRDVSTELLQFFHAKMREHNVNFIGGDFNMSAFYPRIFCTWSLCLWGLGALEEQHRECIGFLIMPKRPCEWRVDSRGCHKFDNAALGFGLRDQSAHLQVFLHFRNTNLPGPRSIMRRNCLLEIFFASAQGECVFCVFLLFPCQPWSHATQGMESIGSASVTELSRTV